MIGSLYARIPIESAYKSMLVTPVAIGVLLETDTNGFSLRAYTRGFGLEVSTIGFRLRAFTEGFE
eukprot:7736782-Pyramimonas_sp.AAC.1